MIPAPAQSSPAPRWPPLPRPPSHPVEEVQPPSPDTVQKATDLWTSWLTQPRSASDVRGVDVLSSISLAGPAIERPRTAPRSVLPRFAAAVDDARGQRPSSGNHRPTGGYRPARRLLGSDSSPEIDALSLPNEQQPSFRSPAAAHRPSSSPTSTNTTKQISLAGEVPASLSTRQRPHSSHSSLRIHHAPDEAPQLPKAPQHPEAPPAPSEDGSTQAGASGGGTRPGRAGHVASSHRAHLLRLEGPNANRNGRLWKIASQKYGSVAGLKHHRMDRLAEKAPPRLVRPATKFDKEHSRNSILMKHYNHRVNEDPCVAAPHAHTLLAAHPRCASRHTTVLTCLCYSHALACAHTQCPCLLRQPQTLSPPSLRRVHGALLS